jgi:hypothetical protein
MDERTLQFAAAELERTWLKSATDKELELLELSGERPDLFEKGDDDGEIRIVLGYELENGKRELVMSTGLKTPSATVSENAAALVFHRTRIRSRLGPAEQRLWRKSTEPGL